MDQGDGMAGDGPPKSGDGKRSRRAPPPTLDLTATPVPDQQGAAPDSAAPAPDAASMAAAAMESAESAAPDDAKSAAESSASVAKPLPDGLNFANPIEETPGEPPPAEPKRRFGLPGSWLIIGPAAAGVALTAAVALTIAWQSAATPPNDPALADRLTAIEAQVAALAHRPQPATADPKEIAALGARIAEIELQLRNLPRGPTQADVDPNRVVALERRVEDVTKRLAAIEQIGRRIDEMAAEIAKIETTLAQPRSSEPDLALSNRLAAVDTAVKSLLGRVADLDKRLDALAAATREAASAPPVAGTPDQAVRVAFLATALRGAVERGEPFAAELAALKTLASNKASLAPLEAFATTGVPSANALSHELSALVPALLAAATPPQGDASLMDRVGMKQLIRIRRVGDTPGDDPVSVIARIEVKAAHDDIVGALAEFAKLPENVRAPAAAWIKKATQRIAAVAATRQLTADALAGLATPAPKPAP